MAEKNTKPVHGPGGRGPKGPRPKVENPGRLFMRLLAYIMKNYAVHCILVVICIFITVLASVQGTWFMQTLIDSYILPLIGQADPDFSGLLHAIMRVAVFYLIGAIASYIYTRIMVNVSQGTLKNLRDDMFTHMEELPIRYFDTHYHGDIMSTYTNDIDTLRQMISQSMPQFLNSIITIVSVFVSMLLLNVPLTIVTLLMIGVTLFATKKIGALSAKYFIAQQKDIATVNGYIEEMMNGQKVVKVFTHEEESIENFNRLNDQLFHSADNANKFGNILMPVNAQIGNISYVLCALVGGVLALNGIGGFTLGKLASFLTYNKSFSQPVNQLSMQLNNIVMALAGSERIFKLLDEEPETDEGYASIILGMGMSTLPVYLILATLVAPALTKMGIPPIAAHLFIFYYGIIAAITPPVAIAAYAGASIAKEDPIKVGLTACRLGVGAYILPFMFAFGPALVLQGTPLEIAQSIVTAIVGISCLGMAFEGYIYKIGNVNVVSRVLLIAGALCLTIPGTVTDLVGLALVVVTVALSIFMNKTAKAKAA